MAGGLQGADLMGNCYPAPGKSYRNPARIACLFLRRVAGIAFAE
jgi:hypothetical protein